MSAETGVSTRNFESPRRAAGTGANHRPRWQGGVEVAWIVLLFFLFGSEAAPAVNEPHYLSRARHFWDPAFCTNDFFLNSRDAHTIFFWCFGWLTCWVSFPWAAWMGRCCGWLLLAAAWHRLSYRLVPKRGASLLSAALWITLIQRCHMSGEWLIGGIEGKVIAYALVLWGLSDWVRDKWNSTWIWEGAGAAFHVLVGGWAVVMTCLAALVQPIPLRERMRRSLPGLLVGGTLALAGLVPAVRLNAGLAPQIVHRAEEIYVFDRISHHLLIRDFAGQFVLRHVLLIAAFAALWQPLRRHVEFRRLAAVVWGAVVLALLGGLLDVALGNSTWAARLLRYYWFRASDVFVPLGVSLAVVMHLARGALRHARVAAMGLAVTICLVVGNLCLTVNALNWQVVPAADRQGGIRDVSELAAWRDVCAWIHSQLPPQATFLTPTDHQTFKWYAQRAELVTWKDVPQDAQSIVEWSERLTRVCRWHESTTVEEATARLEALQGDYHFDFLVVRWPSEFPMPARALLYQNSHYAVLPARSAGLPNLPSAEGNHADRGRVPGSRPHGQAADPTLLGPP